MRRRKCKETTKESLLSSSVHSLPLKMPDYTRHIPWELGLPTTAQVVSQQRLPQLVLRMLLSLLAGSTALSKVNSTTVHRSRGREINSSLSVSFPIFVNLSLFCKWVEDKSTVH